MRPAEFTSEAIIQAGQDLQAEGRNITSFALRRKVGGGKPNRLKQVWDEHLAKQSVNNVEPVSELPVEVADKVAAMAKALNEQLAALAVDLNDKAVKASERRVTEVVRAAGEQREQAERELVDAAATVDDLESRLDEAWGNAEGLEARLAGMQIAHQSQAVELAQLRERLTLVLQAGEKVAEEHAAELTRLNASIETERARHHAEMDEVKKAIQAAAGERDQARSELVRVKTKAEAVENTHQEQRKQAAAEALRMAERLTQAQGDRDKARKEAGAAREDAAKLRGQVESLQAQAGDIMRALAARDSSSNGESK